MNSEPTTIDSAGSEDSYPLKSTATLINDRLGLFLSADQQRGLATGLLVGVAVGAAVISWNVGCAIRRRL